MRAHIPLKFLFKFRENKLIIFCNTEPKYIHTLLKIYLFTLQRTQNQETPSSQSQNLLSIHVAHPVVGKLSCATLGNLIEIGKVLGALFRSPRAIILADRVLPATGVYGGHHELVHITTAIV